MSLTGRPWGAGLRRSISAADNPVLAERPTHQQVLTKEGDPRRTSCARRKDSSISSRYTRGGGKRRGFEHLASTYRPCPWGWSSPSPRVYPASVLRVLLS